MLFHRLAFCSRSTRHFWTLQFWNKKPSEGSRFHCAPAFPHSLQRYGGSRPANNMQTADNGCLLTLGESGSSGVAVQTVQADHRLWRGTALLARQCFASRSKAGWLAVLLTSAAFVLTGGGEQIGRNDSLSRSGRLCSSGTVTVYWSAACVCFSFIVCQIAVVCFIFVYWVASNGQHTCLNDKVKNAAVTKKKMLHCNNLYTIKIMYTHFRRRKTCIGISTKNLFRGQEISTNDLWPL